MAYSNFKPLAYATTSGAAVTVSFDPENWLMVVVRIAGYAGSAIAQLQFNGDTGTTAYAYSVSNNFAAPTTAVAATAAGIKVSATATTGPRSILVFYIRNINGQPHGITWTGSDLQETAATAPSIVNGAGTWTTTSQINRITLDAGGSTFTAGTDIAVFGMGGVV